MLNLSLDSTAHDIAVCLIVSDESELEGRSSQI